MISYKGLTLRKRAVRPTLKSNKRRTMSRDAKLHLAIKGMTCVNCQNLIKKTLDKAPGIQSASVSYKTNTADIVYRPDAISPQEIDLLIHDVGYSVVSEDDVRFNLFIKTTFSVSIIALAFLLIQHFNLLNYLVPSQLAQSGMGYGMLFVIGLITSVHCIAMCGGINLSQCLPLNAAEDQMADPKATPKASVLATLRPSFAYNAGRVVSYTIIGFILGLVGMLIGAATGSVIPQAFQGALKIVAGIIMVVMGINMLGLFTGLRSFSLPFPKKFARIVGSKSASSRRPFVVGLLNGLMPCGPLQSMQIIALASGNPFVGALSMMLFSLGTVPLMLGFGSFVSALGTKFRTTVNTVGAVLVAVLGLALLLQGTGMANLLPTNTVIALVLFAGVGGIVANIPTKQAVLKVVGGGIVALFCVFSLMQGLSPASLSANASSAQAKIVNGKQVVESTLESGAYPDISVKVGAPVRWVINAPASAINGCNKTMDIADYGVEHTFSPGKNVIEFTPTKSGSVRALCWMGMIEGTITVTN